MNPQAPKIKPDTIRGGTLTRGNGHAQKHKDPMEFFRTRTDRELEDLRKSIDAIKERRGLKYSYCFYETDEHFQLFKVGYRELFRARIDKDTLDLVRNRTDAVRFDEIISWFENNGRIVFEPIVIDEEKLVNEIAKNNSVAGDFFCKFFRPYFLKDEKGMPVEEIVGLKKRGAFEKEDIATMIDTVCVSLFLHVR